MSKQTRNKLYANSFANKENSIINKGKFSKDYVDFLREAGWRLEKKRPSNSNNYSDLLEDTDWNSNDVHFSYLKHYRRDLDALS